eukprot:m.389635 g.389635  ORF g.389635 m.389635 type:complete len:594 (-) comp20071_c6_seq1:182-1963(-)
MAAPRLHETIALGITADRYYLRPAESSNCLVIDRLTKAMFLEADHGQLDSLTLRSICGVVGIISLLSGPHLVVITKRKLVGYINGHQIWEVADTAILPYARTTTSLGEHQLADEQTYQTMVAAMLGSPGLYFSYTYHLTHTLQRQQAFAQGDALRPQHELADPRFYWNRFLQKDMSRQPQLAEYMLPVLHGFVSMSSQVINGTAVDLILVSRRSVQRAGTRHFRRGIDEAGSVANFVETEQILRAGHTLCSFVQTRGSMPLFWNQAPNLKYKPRVAVDATADHTKAFRLHVEDQIQRYGNNVAINLVNQHGSEKVLADAFSTLVAAARSNFISYEAFDFHHECRRMRWDRLQLLIDRVSPAQDSHGFCVVEVRRNEHNVHRTQGGVFRTNCMDCLDRTNVVQSMLARRSLEQQLQFLQLMSDTESLQANHPGFDRAFKSIWADNADACSLQYSGSKALKTDFTRTGKRTFPGMLQDGYSSLLRYYKNNLADGHRQDAFDLFLGNYVPHPDEGATLPSRFIDHRPLKWPLLLLFALAMFVILQMFPSASSSWHWFQSLVWVATAAVAIVSIFREGARFVDSPRLCHPLGRLAPH